MVLQYEREFQIAALRSSDTDPLAPSNLSTSLAPGGWINVFIEQPSNSGLSPSNESTGGGDNKSLFSPFKKRSPQAPTSYISNGTNTTNSDSYSSGEDEESLLRSGPQSFAPPSVVHYHDMGPSSRSVYSQVWRGIQSICSDPCPTVALKAGSIIQGVHDKVGGA